MSFSIPCRVCGKPVHGEHDGKGYKVGSYKFAVCLDHVQAVERTRAVALQTVKIAARELVRHRFPRLHGAIEAIREVALNEDFHNE